MPNFHERSHLGSTKKLLFIIRHISPYWAQAISALGRQWSNRGTLTVIFAGWQQDPLHPWNAGSNTLEGVDLIHAPSKQTGGTDWPAQSMWRTVCEIDADLVIIHEYSPYTILSGFLWAQSYNRPCLISSEVGSDYRKSFSLAQRIIHFSVNAAAKGMLARTPAAYRQESFAAKPRHFAPHAIKVRDYSNARTPRTKSAEVRIVQVGSLIPRKGIDLLLRAFHKAIGENPDLRLTLIGSGDHASARQLADALKISHALDLLEFLQPAALIQEYVKSDVFVLASRFDTYGVVTHEAAAAGMPLVVSKFAGSAEALVTDGENGYCIDPNDCEAFAAALIKASDPKNRTRFGEASLKIAQYYDADAIAARLADWLAEIATKPGTRGQKPPAFASRFIGLVRILKSSLVAIAPKFLTPLLAGKDRI